MRWNAISLAVAVVAAGFVVAGCDPAAQITLNYQRPAKHPLPQSIQKLGIAEFGGTDADDRQWGSIASDRLASSLHEAGRKFGRYELVDRKRLKAILDEQDLQAAFSTTDAAVAAGKIAATDAMIYGTVNVECTDEPVTRSSFDPLARGMTQKTETRRYVMAAVNFTLVDVNTTSTLATVSTLREFDSQKADSGGGASKALGMVGVGGSKLPASDEVLSGLIDECVDEFLATISPHEVSVTEKLGKGKSEAVKTGNKLATAGEYAEALELYEAAIGQNPQDHEAMFNAGVINEKLGQLDRAYERYDAAFKLKPQQQYILARKRVKTEQAGQ